MSWIAVGVVVLLWALISYQAALAWRFWRALRAFRVPLIPDDRAPTAEVILCLRGTDPFLANCINGLLDQDYPNYTVRIVVDGPDDPAHQTLAEVLAEHPTSRVRIENLTKRYASCSLKCSALIQAITSLDSNCEIVAQIDADTVPHRTWLRELATALVPDEVGAATGNRWYMPADESLGGLVRYVWNAGAVTQMLHHNIAWGGTMATKASIFRRSDLLSRWQQALCEDALMHSALQETGLKVAFVPSLMMINRESISIALFFRWIKRQMLLVRLYHDDWRSILLHSTLTILVPLTGLTLLILGGISAEKHVCTALQWSLNCFGVAFLACLLPLIGAVREVVAHRGEQTKWITWRGVLKMFVAFPLTPLVYAGATFAAAFARQTEWRGIRYHVDGPWQIRMDRYWPYKPESKAVAKRDKYRSVA